MIRPLGATASATGSATDFPPDLADVVAAWQMLPEAIRAGIMAMIRATRV